MLETVESITAAAWDAACVAVGVDDEQWAFAADVAERSPSTARSRGEGLHPGARRDRLHLRARRPPLPAPRAARCARCVGSGRTRGRLAASRPSGVRRATSVDLGGRDADHRDEARATAERIGALAPEEQRAALVETGLAGAALAGAVRPGRGRGAPSSSSTRSSRPPASPGPTSRSPAGRCRRSSGTAPRSSGSGSSGRRCSARSPGASCSPSRTPARTWRRCGPGRCATATAVASSPGRRCGRRWRSEADWAICLARTDPDAPQHKGITYFLLDMTVDRHRHPAAARDHRGGAVQRGLPRRRVRAGRLRGRRAGGRLEARPHHAVQRAGGDGGSRLGVSIEGASRRSASSSDVLGSGTVALATVCSLLGVRSTLGPRRPGPRCRVERGQAARRTQPAGASAELVVELLGPSALLGGGEAPGDAVHEMLVTRCLSIAGGTTQILRNVAAERILGLPRG